MNEQIKKPLAEKAVQLGGAVNAISKTISALAVIGAALVAGWTQYLGPGLKPSVQGFVGVTEMRAEMRENTEALIERVSFIEQNMDPIPVVSWNLRASRQIGDCTYERCVYSLNGYRTNFGEDCGEPARDDIVPFIRTARGQNIQADFVNLPRVKLTREPTTFQVQLQIPHHLEEGHHEFHVRIMYPTCPGIREPIPRWTPWFPIEVTKP